MSIVIHQSANMLLQLIIFAVLTLALALYHWYSTIPKNIPPQGPLCLPFIGHPVRPYKGELYLKIKEWGEKYGPIFSMYVGNQLVVVMTSYDVIKEAFVKQADMYLGKMDADILKELNLTKGLLLSEGPLWKEQRRFALSTLRDFGLGKPIVEHSIVEELRYVCDEITNMKHRPLDCQDLLNNAVSNIICQLVFGRRFPYDDQEFQKVLRAFSSETRGNVFSTIFMRPWMLKLPSIKQEIAVGTAHLRGILSFVKPFIDDERSNFVESAEPTNYIQSFLHAQANKSGDYFTDIQLLMSVHSLFAAGTETTSTTLRWALLLCATYPEVQSKVQAELDKVVGQPDKHNSPTLEQRKHLPYTEAVLLEIQRYASLVPLSLRYMREDSTLMSFNIPKDTVVLRSNFSVHRDPNLYPFPNEFRPEHFLDASGAVRRSETFLPFGIGKRSCLGEALAKMELYLFFTCLIHKFYFSFPNDQAKCSLKAMNLGVTRQPFPFKIVAVER